MCQEIQDGESKELIFDSLTGYPAQDRRIIAQPPWHRYLQYLGFALSEEVKDDSLFLLRTYICHALEANG